MNSHWCIIQILFPSDSYSRRPLKLLIMKPNAICYSAEVSCQKPIASKCLRFVSRIWAPENCAARSPVGSGCAGSAYLSAGSRSSFYCFWGKLPSIQNGQLVLLADGHIDPSPRLCPLGRGWLGAEIHLRPFSERLDFLPHPVSAGFNWSLGINTWPKGKKVKLAIGRNMSMQF